MMAVAEEVDVYRAAFDRFVAERSAEPAWLREARVAAIARFSERGFPTTREEEWRQTSVAAIARAPFRLAEAGDGAGISTRAALAFAGLRTVFVNGRFVPELSAGDGRLPRGVEILSLREGLSRHPERLEPRLTRVAGDSANVFASLNTAFFEDGAVVLLSPGVVVEEPIHLVFLSGSPDSRPVVSYPRNLIVAGRGSQARIVESYGGAEGQIYFTCPVTEIVVEDGAGVDHYKLQRESEAAFHVATLAVRQERASRFSNHSISLGAALSRNDIDVVLGAEGGECVLNGLFMADGERHTDTHTRIDHAQPHCSSRELYKGILDGRGRGVFHGRIIVRKGAQKTDAYQTNKNLLLSREALVDSTPQLEIFADDVKCKHGSTTGQLDPDALFYLRSRGIPEAAARSLLTYAFASDLVNRISVAPLRAAVEEHLQAHLASAPEIKEAVV